MKLPLICVASLMAAASVVMADAVDVQPTDPYTTVLGASGWRPAQKVYSLSNTSYQWLYWESSDVNGLATCSPPLGWVAPGGSTSIIISPVSAMTTVAPGTYGEQITFSFVPRLVGDVNGDDAVDLRDLLSFAAGWGAGPGDPNFNPVFDFNGDGQIDIVDLLYLAESFGRVFGSTTL
jgi:hypothetical protein